MFSLIIPAFEEEKIIGDLVSKALAVKGVEEVIVVDDGSKDNTAQVAKESGARVISHPYNMGNGAAVKTGIRHAKSDVLVFLDGDGQHDPNEIPALAQEISNYGMIVGSRSRKDHAGFWRRWANHIYNILATYVTQFPIEDLTSGFRVIHRKIAKRYLYLLPNTFSYPSTITMALLKSGIPIRYVPIKVSKRVGKSKIKLIQDGSRFFMIILKITMLFSPLRVFIPLSLFIFLLGLMNYAYTYIRFHKFTNMSALLVMMSVLLFMLGMVAEQISMLRMDRSEDESH